MEQARGKRVWGRGADCKGSGRKMPGVFRRSYLGFSVMWRGWGQRVSDEVQRKGGLDPGGP